MPSPAPGGPGAHDQHRDSLSVPHLRRPATSRAHSYNSSRSHRSTLSVPRPQHRDYVATGDSLTVGMEIGDAGIDQYLYDDPVLPFANEEDSLSPTAHQHRSHSRSHLDVTATDEEYHDDPSRRPSDVSGGGSRTPATPGTPPGEEDDWETARLGSIARRSFWRRPRSVWIYPFVVGSTLSMGMGMAPKSEILINLACLAHPPRQHTSFENYSTGLGTIGHDIGQTPIIVEPSQPNRGDDDGSISVPPWIGDDTLPGNNTLPLSPVPSPSLPEPPKKSRSAADEWFLKIQHEIYEWQLAHSHHNQKDTTPSATATPSRAMPSGPIPHPTNTPSGDPNQGDGNQGGEGDGNQTETPSPPTHGPSMPKPPFHVIDPALCKRDPQVQAATARFTMSLTLTLGILSALTTGYWGERSDRHGRTKIMTLCEIGIVCSDACFILVTSYPYLAPGGYRSLLFGAAIDGCLGGFSLMAATVHAYVSDTTPDGSRASKFARLAGVMMSGFALGPILGSILISRSGNIMAPFYINIILHTIHIPLILFVLPESLSTEARKHLWKQSRIVKEARRRRDELEREWEDELPEIYDPVSRTLAGQPGTPQSKAALKLRRRKKMKGNMKRFGRKMFKFLRPLSIFAPTERADGRPGKDYNLTFVGAGLFSSSLMMGIVSMKTQYAFYAYGWTSAQLGPYMSMMGATRGVVLLVIVPIAMYYAKPHFRQSTNIAESEEQQQESESAIRDASVSTSASTPAKPKRPQPSMLDLLTLKICMFIVFIGYVLMALGLSAPKFILCTLLITFGSADGPAVNSLALSLIPSQAEAGRLFGAISVINAIGSSLISPLLFGNIFAATVGWYAPTIFGVAACLILMAQICIWNIKLEQPDPQNDSERGRSRRVKRVNSSGSGLRPPKMKGDRKNRHGHGQ